MRSPMHGLVLALMVLLLTCPLSFAEQAAADKPADKPDPYAVPEGSMEERVDFLKKMLKKSWGMPVNTEEAGKIRAALIQAADGVLAADPDEKQLALVVTAKLRALRNGWDKLNQFADELKKDGYAKHSRNVRGYTLGRKLRFIPHKQQDTIKKRITELVDFLGEEMVDAGADAQLAKLVGWMAETTGDVPFAVDTYRKLQEIFVASDDPRAVRKGKAIDGIIRRVTLVGNTMTIEGTIIGGGPFDWSKYQGKVVLVDFFATSCAPCLREVKTIRKNYDLYHDKGFDVVGIGCDRNHVSLEKYVESHKLPWPIVYGDKKPSPTAAYYGILGLPQLILVGKDGKVITLNARGDRLRKELEKLLGPVEESRKRKPKKGTVVQMVLELS